MDKAWLDDYYQRELSEYQEFTRTLSANKTGPIAPFPRKDRFWKLQDPISTVASDIWAELPFYGSSIVTVKSVPKEKFLSGCGLNGVRDIDKLVDLAKSTGRVQFVLGDPPKYFEGLDYLDSILTELKPPCVIGYPDSFFSLSRMTKRKYQAEFLSLAQIVLIPAMKQVWRKNNDSPKLLDDRVGHLSQVFVYLRIFGYNELADCIANLLMDNAGSALWLLDFFGTSLVTPQVYPIVSTYKPILSWNRDRFRRGLGSVVESGLAQPSQSQTSNTILPHEIGKFLMRKLTYLPEGYEACIALMDRYKQEDLKELMDAFRQGCIQNNVDVMTEKGKELDQVFDNLWKDSSRIKSIAKGITYAMTAYVGVIGTMITGGVGGILATLGWQVADEHFNISGNAAKLGQANYMVVINDFRKKRRI